MKPVEFAQATTVFKGEGCEDLPALVVEDSIISCWKPTEEELKALNEGHPVMLEIIGMQPPVSLYIGEETVGE